MRLVTVRPPRYVSGQHAMRIPLANLLVKSPLPRVNEMMVTVKACAQKVPELVGYLLRGDQAGVERLAKETSILEGAADTVKNLARAEMPVRLFLPVDRRDVLRLISEIDAIADCAEDVGVLLTIRPLTVPPAMGPVLEEFVERVMHTVEAAEDLVAVMDRLVKSGFSGPAAEEALRLVDELGRREHEADKLQDQCAKALFRAEDTMPPVAVFMWTKVLNKIGDMANHAENVGDQFRLFVAR
ncbi:MAG: TIGR00153 family protein [Sandaracinus sp.]|nr:TIGR00153 family protein [Sandaracinus sp.]